MKFCEYTFEVPAAVWIGIVAAIISLLQLKIANIKIKLDLYDKRFSVYQSVIEFINVERSDDNFPEVQKKFNIAFRASHLLFKKSDYMSFLVIAIQSKKEEMLELQRKQNIPEKMLYDPEALAAHSPIYVSKKKELHLLVVEFEKKIATYIELRSIGGFDLKWWSK